MGICSDVAADLVEMHLHGARVGEGEHKDALNAKSNLPLRCCGCRVSTGPDRRLAMPRRGLNGEW